MVNVSEKRMREIIKSRTFLADEADIFCYKDANRTYWLDRRTTWQKDGCTATVFPFAMDDKRVFVVCPFCKDIHVHGHGEGFRTPDCPKLTNVYFVAGIM